MGDGACFWIIMVLPERRRDKVKEAGLTMEDAEMNGVPVIKEYPLTIECIVLYSQDQVLEKISGEIIDRFYSGELVCVI